LRQPLDLLNLSSEIKPRLLTALCQERAIGQRLRALRHQRQLSLEVPAERSGVSVSMLSTVERGQRVPSILYHAGDCEHGYPSLRDPGGRCAGLFCPDAARDPTQGRHFGIRFRRRRPPFVPLDRMPDFGPFTFIGPKQQSRRAILSTQQRSAQHWHAASLIQRRRKDNSSLDQDACLTGAFDGAPSIPCPPATPPSAAKNFRRAM